MRWLDTSKSILIASQDVNEGERMIICHVRLLYNLFEGYVILSSKKLQFIFGLKRTDSIPTTTTSLKPRIASDAKLARKGGDKTRENDARRFLPFGIKKVNLQDLCGGVNF